MPKNTIKSRAKNDRASSSFKGSAWMGDTTLNVSHQLKCFLEHEIRSLQQRMKTGYEVRLKWLPGVVRRRDGKRLAEEVRGNTVIIYADNRQEAIELVRHGFMEWVLNQQTKPYRQLINRLIALFEELQYEKKERTIDALTRLL